MSVFYSKPQQLDVYVNDVLVPANNAEVHDDQTDYTLKEPMYPGADALHACR